MKFQYNKNQVLKILDKEIRNIHKIIKKSPYYFLMEADLQALLSQRLRKINGMEFDSAKFGQEYGIMSCVNCEQYFGRSGSGCWFRKFDIGIIRPQDIDWEESLDRMKAYIAVELKVKFSYSTNRVFKMMWQDASAFMGRPKYAESGIVLFINQDRVFTDRELSKLFMRLRNLKKTRDIKHVRFYYLDGHHGKGNLKYI